MLIETFVSEDGVPRLWDEVQPDALPPGSAGQGRPAGLPRPVGAKAPRPYDFRHHFAYANLHRWMADGTDTAAMVPYLSAYMGHAEVASTYYYIHTSPDFLDDYAHITQGLLPEVGFE